MVPVPLADLLHPVPDAVVVNAAVTRGAELAEERLHAGELVVNVVEVALDAADEGVLLCEEAAELAQQGLHCRLRGAHHQFLGGPT
ncbi:hypothetical protein E2562_014896 [Oryza meyeriana var. granulata]|uniref:Uncharacterized protein n=1 Tax=Oryza meyeriana var. granulata TaxID=110450 RepID=A0A6G1EJ59_9ORYZ|nr:hypothetical protein E2562_014896 [Oryza meyeriana var. granulata]